MYESYTIDPENVEGDMSSNQSPRQNQNIADPDFSTLDEPIKDTFVRTNSFFIYQFF